MKNLIKLVLILGVVVSQQNPVSTYSTTPRARAGIGAITTQSFSKIEYGPQGPNLMAEGSTAKYTLRKHMAGDLGRGRSGSSDETNSDLPKWFNDRKVSDEFYYGVGMAKKRNSSLAQLSGVMVFQIAA